MREYTPEERREARTRLPAPIADFLGSNALNVIYIGIRDKLRLNLQQLMIVSDIANVTLLGLEPEHALEANLHQYLSEMSNADMRELVADLNDRVFKEAQRRLRENVLEPKTPKLIVTYDSEGEPHLEGERQNDASEVQTHKEQPEPVVAEPAETIGNEEAPENVRTVSVSEERLSSLVSATTTTTVPSSAQPAPAGIRNVTKPAAVPPPAVTAVPAVPAPVPQAAPITRRYPGGVDPYREPIE